MNESPFQKKNLSGSACFTSLSAGVIARVVRALPWPDRERSFRPQWSFVKSLLFQRGPRSCLRTFDVRRGGREKEPEREATGPRESSPTNFSYRVYLRSPAHCSPAVEERREENRARLISLSHSSVLLSRFRLFTARLPKTKRPADDPGALSMCQGRGLFGKSAENPETER